MRASPEPETGWRLWRGVRDDLFRTHPQSPLPPEDRAAFAGVEYYPYDVALRVLADVAPTRSESLRMVGSAGSAVHFTRFGVAQFELGGDLRTLELYWLEGYGGGVFLPFNDETTGHETYGGGRYLLDTVKGADLGMERGRLVLDFNFAYNPSCSYDVRWACPLPPAANTLDLPVRAGERTL